MRTKKVHAVLRALAPIDLDSSSPPSTIRRLRPGDAGARAATGRRGRAYGPDAASALAMADGDPVVVAGSLYLVGAIRGMLVGSGEED